MPKNLKDFAEVKFEEQQIDAQTFFDSHKNMSQKELLEELTKEVSKQKNNGTFDYEKLKNTIDILSPYLNQAQKQSMENILQGLK